MERRGRRVALRSTRPMIQRGLELAPGRVDGDCRGPGRRRALDAFAAATLEIGFPAVAALGCLAVSTGGRCLALAAQLIHAVADRVEIVRGSGAVHRNLRLSDQLAGAFCGI